MSRPDASTGSTSRARRTRHEIERLGGYENGPDATLRATRAALERIEGAESIVLVEGVSDQVAVEATAARLGRRLLAEGVVVAPIGGAQAAERFVAALGARAPRRAGLCDRAEAVYFERALGPAVVFVCDPDLESELIRSFTAHELEAILDAEGDLSGFRTLQKQPEWRDRPFGDQMHRWLRSRARRTSHYAGVLVAQAALDRLPPPLVGLTRHI